MVLVLGQLRDCVWDWVWEAKKREQGDKNGLKESQELG